MMGLGLGESPEAGELPGSEENPLRSLVGLTERLDLAPPEEILPGEHLPERGEAPDLAPRETNRATGGLDDEPATLIGAHAPTPVQLLNRTDLVLRHSLFPPVGHRGLATPLWRNARVCALYRKGFYIFLYFCQARVIIRHYGT